jgi:hypothetical protein
MKYISGPDESKRENMDESKGYNLKYINEY